MYELKNYTEAAVRQALQDYLKLSSLNCGCERCQSDIMAMALNRLPARYFVSLRGEILTQWESQALPDQARIMSEVVRACQHVDASPSHEVNEEN